MWDIKNSMKINKLYSDNFNKNGYIIIKNFLSEKINNSFRNALIYNYKTYLDKKINKKNISEIIAKYELENNWDKLYYAFKKFSNSSQFKIVSNKLKKFIELNFKKKNRLINNALGLAIKKSNRTSYNWHQEKPYYKNISTLHFQFPIMRSCTRKNGTMSVLTGSHKLGFIKKIKSDQLHKKSVYSYIPRNINVITKKFSEKFINMKLGDLVMFDENVIHKSNINRTNKIRFVGIIRHQLLGDLR